MSTPSISWDGTHTVIGPKLKSSELDITGNTNIHGNLVVDGTITPSGSSGSKIYMHANATFGTQNFPANVTTPFWIVRFPIPAINPQNGILWENSSSAVQWRVSESGLYLINVRFGAACNTNNVDLRLIITGTDTTIANASTNTLGSPPLVMSVTSVAHLAAGSAVSVAALPLIASPGLSFSMDMFTDYTSVSIVKLT